jgi:hypothetical protein
MGNAGADLPEFQGRLPSLRNRANQSQWTRRGSGDGMCAHGDRAQHGKPHRWRSLPTGNPRGPGRADWGGGEARSTDEAG